MTALEAMVGSQKHAHRNDSNQVWLCALNGALWPHETPALCTVHVLRVVNKTNSLISLRKTGLHPNAEELRAVLYLAVGRVVCESGTQISKCVWCFKAA